MTDTTSTPEKTSFFAKARKAFVGGATAAAGTLAVSLPLTLADGGFSTGDIYTVLGYFVGGFAAGFAAVYATPNATS